MNVAYPLGRSFQEANYARAEVARRQSSIDLRELELRIVQQVRDAARQVENSYQRVLVTRAALRASEQQLDAEQRRFAAGLATNLELQVRQQELANARIERAPGRDRLQPRADSVRAGAEDRTVAGHVH